MQHILSTDTERGDNREHPFLEILNTKAAH
jgi:hypothetical protein